jgi:DNA polymerase-3 subunit beta
VVTIVAEAQDEGKTQEDVEATCQGESLQIAFNAKFIAEALGVIDAEGIYLDLTDSLKPAVLRPVQPDAGPNDTYLCVLMPMQLT